MPTYKPYSIQKLDNEHVFVIPKDYRGIDYVLPMVNLELRTKKFIGNVIFDLLLSNGNNKRRFFNSFFNGSNFNAKSFISISSPPEQYLRVSNKFIKSHPDILNRGTLRSIDIEGLKEQLDIK